MSIGRTSINLVAGIVAMGSNFVVNIVLAPFLVSSLGPEAFGFVGMVNSIVGVASIFTASLNLMAGRHIATAVHQRRESDAQILFNSVLAANLVFCAGYAIVCLVLVLNLENWFSVSSHLVSDVQLAFCAVFANLAVTSLAGVFGASTLVRNRLDAAAARDILSQFVRVSSVALLFVLYSPRVSFVGLGALIAGVFLLVSNYRLARSLLPEIRLRVADVRVSQTFLLVGSGASYLLNGLGGFLSGDASLILVNVFLGGGAMGLLSLARTVPMTVSLLSGTVARAFAPDLMRMHANGDMNGMGERIVTAMKVVAFVVSVPVAGFLAVGQSFIALWLPTLTEVEVRRVFLVAAIVIVGVLADAYTSPFFPLFVAAGRILPVSFVSIVFGLLSTLFVVLVLKLTDYGIVGVAALGSFLTVLRVSFLPAYGARLLRIRASSFARQFGRELVAFGLITAGLAAIARLWAPQTWSSLLAFSLVCGAIGYACNFVVLLNRKEKKDALRRFRGLLGLGS